METGQERAARILARDQYRNKLSHAKTETSLFAIGLTGRTTSLKHLRQFIAAVARLTDLFSEYDEQVSLMQLKIWQATRLEQLLHRQSLDAELYHHGYHELRQTRRDIEIICRPFGNVVPMLRPLSSFSATRQAQMP